VSTHVLDLKLEISLRPLGGALKFTFWDLVIHFGTAVCQILYLEGHVLKEMGHSIILVVLVPGTGVDPNSDGGSWKATVLGGHSHAIVQLGQLRRWQID